MLNSSMPSPFPGMDPFLEGYLWPDVHATLASNIRQILAPLLRPKYVVRLEVSVTEDKAPEEEIGVMYPDVEVLRDLKNQGSYSQTSYGSATPATLTVPVLSPVTVKLISVHIQDRTGNQLVTSIEILSPVNKHEPGSRDYQLKRQRMMEASVHLIELDFLRRGKRAIKHPQVQSTSYVVALTRAEAGRTDVWALSLEDELPKIPVPLLPPDEDVILDLQTLFTTCYDEAGYDLSIDYKETPPPPELSENDKRFLKQLLKG
jgi:Protein of unknown function (DUF4058)